MSKVKELAPWYKTLDLLSLQLQSLREDIPLNLMERGGYDMKDLESFDMTVRAMKIKLDRAVEELTNQGLHVIEKDTSRTD